MNLQRPKNTKDKGLIELFVYPEKDRFIGVCLTFDIIEEGEDFLEVMKNLKEASLLHLKVIINKGLSDDLLNRYAPEEYWEKFFDYLNKLRQTHVAHLEQKYFEQVPFSAVLRNFVSVPA